MDNQVNQQPQENVNPFPSLETTVITEPVWFLLKLKSDIEIVEENELRFKRSTESNVLVTFNNEVEAQNYFEALHNQPNLEFNIITDYLKN